MFLPIIFDNITIKYNAIIPESKTDMILDCLVCVELKSSKKVSLGTSNVPVYLILGKCYHYRHRWSMVIL